MITGAKQAAVLRLSLTCVIGGGQQGGIDVQLTYRVLVKNIQQVFRRAVVLAQMVNIGTATVAQILQCLQSGTHKREYRLLLIAQIHYRGIVGCKQVYYRQLQEVEILHLIYLYPLVAMAVFVLRGVYVRLFQQVLKVQQTVSFLIFGIQPCQFCLALSVWRVRLRQSVGMDY